MDSVDVLPSRLCHYWVLHCAAAAPRDSRTTGMTIRARVLATAALAAVAWNLHLGPRRVITFCGVTEGFASRLRRKRLLPFVIVHWLASPPIFSSRAAQKTS